MRRIVMLGCLAASAMGCEATRPNLSCGPCALRPQAGAALAPSKLGAPSYLPPTVREVRGSSVEDVAESRPQAAAVNQDVLLIPRWVYVPYSPHVPSGPTKLPGGAATGPFVQTNGQMTVMPPMGGSQPNDTMEECLQQMKLLNARIGELEAKNASRSTIAAPMMPSVPQMLPAAPQMLPLPPIPAMVPAIPMAK